MNRVAVFLLTASCCVTWGSSIYPTYIYNRQVHKKLKYLIEPLVYAEVTVRRGENATLPCMLQAKPSSYKVKWTKLGIHQSGVENIIMVSNIHAHKPYGVLGRRASLRRTHDMDLSLQLSHVDLGDDGRYRCELVNGMDDESVVVTLSVEGVVFPYQSRNGRYKLTFNEAKEACAGQDGTLATFKQLYKALTEGLDWCNAGWLVDGTVHYPILHPRASCGGGLVAGIRSYGPKDLTWDRFDAFCFTSVTTGSVFFLGGRMSFAEAERACRAESAELALVGQLYAAWRFVHYDRCNGGWLQDGSVRFPIVTPRERCGGLPSPGVVSFGFPDKSLRLYGAYCYR